MLFVKSFVNNWHWCLSVTVVASFSVVKDHTFQIRVPFSFAAMMLGTCLSSPFALPVGEDFQRMQSWIYEIDILRKVLHPGKDLYLWVNVSTALVLLP
jgi:hypothetical protein